MSDTPRTDAAIKASNGFWSFVLRDLAQELERELSESIESHAFQVKLNREVIEREKQTHAELEQERQDRKQAELDALRALGERNDARAELAVWKHEVDTLRDQLKAEHETAISLFIELHELKQREP